MLEFRERKMFSVSMTVASFPQRWSVCEGMTLGTTSRRRSHHWPPLVNLFSLRSKDINRNQGVQHLVTTTHPVSIHSGSQMPPASMYLNTNHVHFILTDSVKNIAGHRSLLETIF